MISMLESLESAFCVDCAAPLQEAPTWRENKTQAVYRCPWTSVARFRVEHEDKDLLIYNCNWQKGMAARRLSEVVR